MAKCNSFNTDSNPKTNTAKLAVFQITPIIILSQSAMCNARHKAVTHSDVQEISLLKSKASLPRSIRHWTLPSESLIRSTPIQHTFLSSLIISSAHLHYGPYVLSSSTFTTKSAFFADTNTLKLMFLNSNFAAYMRPKLTIFHWISKKDKHIHSLTLQVSTEVKFQEV